MKEKNIFLTTLGNLGKHRLHHAYFYYDDGKSRMYCDALGISEAGVKYIMSREKIDEIIVIGDGATYEAGDEKRRIRISDDYSETDVNKMSEYSFFRYRIWQYRNGVDLEGLDVLEVLDSDRQKELVNAYQEFCLELKRRIHSYRKGMEFHLLSTDDSVFELLKERVGNLSLEEEIWLKRFIYTNMSAVRKLHPLDQNHNLTISLIPKTKSNSVEIDNLDAIVQSILSDESVTVNLYIDMQELGSSNAFTVISLLTLLSNDDSRHVNIKEIITTHYNAANFSNPIDNNGQRRFEVNNFVSGINAFIKYGKVDIIRDYWQSREIENAHITEMLKGMSYVDAGISLCNIDTLEKGIQMLKKVFSTRADDELPQVETALFENLEKTIRTDYGKLLDETEDTVSMLELARWSYRKKFYQQTLTIIESRVPDEMAAKAMLYYAKDDASREEALKAFKFDYMQTPSYMRWKFGDLDHYFIKTYNRGAIDFVRRADEKDKAYAHCRVLSLSTPAEENHGFILAYSVLDEAPELLEELLDSYYEVSKVRNKLNHSDSLMLSKERRNTDPYRISALNFVQDEIESFLDIYSEAMETARKRIDTEGLPPMVKLTQDDLKAYYIPSEDLKRMKEQSRSRNNRNKRRGDRSCRGGSERYKAYASKRTNERKNVSVEVKRFGDVVITIR